MNYIIEKAQNSLGYAQIEKAQNGGFQFGEAKP